MKIKIKNIHMVGIGGSGMSGIAEVLLNLGYKVTGSDLTKGERIQQLISMGAEVFLDHDKRNLGPAEVLVKSTAVGEDNPEVMEAKSRGIPVIPRAEMLAELMRLKTGIAVAGTHGKTTTTSLLGTVFKEAGYDPTVIIGGRLNTYGSNALMGQGEYLIAEADESDGSFLCLSPIMTLVTNVDADHMDYYPDLSAIEEAFIDFLNKIPFYGINVICGDDPQIQKIRPRIKRPLFSYGFNQGNDLRGEIVQTGLSSRFKVFYREDFWGEVKLNQPGKHNVLNALGVIGLSIQADIDKELIIKGLECFGGVGRRLEQKGHKDGVLVLDDYGHHPREIEVTLETLRSAYPEKRLLVAFQPHRFTRTQALFGDFCRSFNLADLLFLTEIYPASEDPIPGVNGLSLSQGIRQIGKINVRYCPDFGKIIQEIKKEAQPGDILLTLGAGSIWKVGQSFLQGVNDI